MFFRFSLFALLIFNLKLLHAGEKIVLMTSVNLASAFDPLNWKDKREFWPYYFQYLPKLEKTVSRTLQNTNLEFEVIHHADQHHLYQALQSPEVVGIYWISHSAPKRESITFESGGIFDSKGFNVLPIFQAAKPHLKVLGVLGCMSRSNVEPLQRKNPDLQIISYDEKIKAEDQLEEALNQGKKYILESKSKEMAALIPDTVSGIHLKILRFCVSPKDSPEILFPAVRIETVSGKIIATFPKCHDRLEVMATDAFLKLDESDLKLVVNAGERVASADNLPFDLGRFRFEIPEGEQIGQWKLFTKPTGEPFGVYQNVYRFQTKPLK